MLLILETWNDFALNREVRHETNITALFHRALVNAYEADNRKWFVTLEDPINDPNYGTELGRNDLRFYPPKHYRQTVFFTVECKRLRVMRQGGTVQLADKYVDDGIQRFVDDQYSAGLPCGGMLGYVMDNNMWEAFKAVESVIHLKRVKLKIPSRGICKPSKVLPEYEWSADTQHRRGRDTFKIHHALLAVVK